MKLLTTTEPSTTMILLLIITIFFCVSMFKVCQMLRHRNCVSKKRLEGKTVLVTGGTSGMGLEVATDMARRGARVIIACPFLEEGIAAREKIILNTGNRNVEFQKLDLASLESTRRFAANILSSESYLYILVNNAGVIGPGDQITLDNLNYLMQVNYFGAVLLTMLLLPLLKKSGRPGDPSRIVNIASLIHVVGKIDLNYLNEPSNSVIVYPKSKLCLVMFTRELAKKLRGESVVVNSLEPGVVGTRIFDIWTGHFLGHVFRLFLGWMCKTPWQGAQTTLHVSLDEAAGAISGEYFSECRVSRADKTAYDDDLSAKLWKETMTLVKLRHEEVCGS